MDWFNWIGLIFVALLLLPNIIFAIKNRPQENKQSNRVLEIFEQLGRYGSMIFMIFNIPFTCWGFYFENAQIVYIAINSALIFGYYLSWIIYWEKESLTKSLLLSVIPSILFLFSGIMLASIPLIVFAILFTICHIWISVKN